MLIPGDTVKSISKKTYICNNESTL